MTRFSLVALAGAFGCSEYGYDAAAEPPVLTEPTSEAPTEPQDAPPDAPADEPAPEDPDLDPPTEALPPEDDCEDTSDVIYVIDRAEEALYLFDPAMMTFTLLGGLNCPWGSSTPASMAVSREGIAFVRASDNKLYEVDLVDLSCEKTDYGNGSFGDFGMGFSTDVAGGWIDTLFLANEDRVVSLDLASFQTSTINDLPSQSELTGDANGELWAFLPLSTPAQLVQVDKDGGAPITTLPLPGFPDAGDIDTFAFATWGGDFWLFVREYGMGRTTDVYRVTPDGDMTLVWEDSGRDVVGAGVSTCAPAE